MAYSLTTKTFSNAYQLMALVIVVNRISKIVVEISVRHKILLSNE